MSNPNNPELKSFVSISADSHFPIQNLPYGVFKSKVFKDAQVGVAIGDQVLNLSLLEREGHICLSREVFQNGTLNALMQLEPSEWQLARARISELLRADTPLIRDNPTLRQSCLLPQSEVSMQLPVAIGDYTDFYSSREHATNVGSMFRDKNNPLLPNWTHLPVGYHGRASSVVVSGSDFHRPCGQVMPPDAGSPKFATSSRLDYEMEMAFFIGKGSELGQSIPVSGAEDHIFGLVLMNDWSARDIQKWEYQPLGPFVSKSFATSISPWVVPLAALKPFTVKGPKQDPQPLDYLRHPSNLMPHYHIELEVYLQPQEAKSAQRISRASTENLYWSMAQQVAHHTVTGCNVRPGDLMASGTVSGKTEDSRGCLLELTWGGKNPINVGEQQRTFLQDGDEVTMTGWCQGDGYRIGFGEVRGKVLPAKL
ncbi:MAG: fumarylacetoacetase [Oligoflexales bacterium]